MKNKIKITVLELAGCCSTSFIDPGHSTRMQQLDHHIDILSQHGIELLRVNTALKPELITQIPGIESYLENKGTEIFPITIVNNTIVKDKAYPTFSELTEWTGIILNETLNNN